MVDRRAHRAIVAKCLCAFLALAISACTTPPRTAPLNAERQTQYLWPGDDGSDPETLFILTASGGGQRAAALTLGALQALDQIALGDGRTMLDEVDIISSVSGGSVAAAYFALHGRDGFATFEQAFLRQGGNGALLGYGLDPLNLAQLMGPGYTRLDLVIDYFEDTLFGDARYADIVGRRPYLIVNAADMSRGTTFSFTQPWFDLLCAELTAFRLADAVAASAAVPMAFAPLALKDNAPCAAQGVVAEGDRSATALPAWASWIGPGLDFQDHRDIGRLQRARTAQAYLNLDCDHSGSCETLPEDMRTQWLHLLDGGTVDNLGLTEPFRLLSTQEVAPYFLPEIVSGRIKRIVVLVVSARVTNSHEVSQSGSAPGLFTMLAATISNPINAASLGLVAQLMAMIDQGAEDYRDELARFGREVFKEGELRNPEIPDGAPDLERFGLIVDFELIDDAECRARFNEIATSWTIGPREVGALTRIAGPLLAANPELARLVEALGGRMPRYESFSDTCNRLIH